MGGREGEGGSSRVERERVGQAEREGEAERRGRGKE